MFEITASVVIRFVPGNMASKLALGFLLLMVVWNATGTGSSIRISLSPRMLAGRRVTNSKNMYFTGEIQLGSPPQTFRVLFDSGSTYLWLYSSDCWWSWPCWLSRTFNHKRSSSYQVAGGTSSLDFFEGSVYGRYADETLRVGDAKRKVTFLEVTHTTGDFFDGLADTFNGVLGIGFPTTGWSYSSYNVLDALFQYFLYEPELTGYSLHLTKEKYGEIQGGEIIFGDTDTNAFQPETLTMHDLSVSGKWAINLKEVLVNGTLVDRETTAVMDIGTTNIVVPEEIMGTIQSELGIELGKEFSCGLLKFGPTLSFVFDKNEYTLKPSDYAQMHSFIFFEEGCTVSISSHPEKFWILGNAFLSSFYSVWDIKGKQFGLAHQQNQNNIK